MEFNESLLNVVTSLPGGSLNSEYVLLEHCRSYVEQTAHMNSLYIFFIVLLLVFVFYLLYKQGRFNKELKMIKEVRQDES